MDSKDILDDLLEILAEIESRLGADDYGMAREQVAQLQIKAKELLDAVEHDGHTILQAEQVVAEYAAINRPLDPAIDGALFGNQDLNDAMAVIQSQWDHRRRWAAYNAAMSAANSQSGLFSDL